MNEDMISATPHRVSASAILRRLHTLSSLSLLACLAVSAQAQPPHPTTSQAHQARQHLASSRSIKLSKPAALKVTAGLSRAHRDISPLFDRVSPSGRGQISVTRTYSDGTQYIMVGDVATPTSLRWRPFVMVKAEGIKRARDVIAEELIKYTPVSRPQSSPQAGQGYILWVAYQGGHEYIIQTGSGSYDQLPSFVRHLDEAISQNVQPLTPKR